MEIVYFGRVAKDPLIQPPAMDRDRDAEDESLALQLTKKKMICDYFSCQNPLTVSKLPPGSGLWVVLTPLPPPGIVWEILDLNSCW